jgi:hypothetical protein
MPEDVTTEEYLYPLPLVERDQWELAFEPLKADPYAALKLGVHFATLQKYFDEQLIKPRAIIEAFDLAREVLFPYTDFHKSSFDLFKRYTEGNVTYQEEELLKAQGIRF